MYDHNSLEKKIAHFWEHKKIYEKVKEGNGKGERFYFCDGPPYATGQIHPGTAWNKCIKDSVCRYKRARGFNVRAQPGFDTHGLPIEVKVEQEMKLTSKKDIEKIGVGKFTESCKAFAIRYVGIMGKQFQRCGVWMDWDNPYLTYKDSFIDKSWGTIKKAEEKKLLEKGVYVLPYCPRCETTIANYELEYGEQTDPSIYVKFKVKGKENEYLIVWTTTPWTLVANMAVMVHPMYEYVYAKVEGETWIVAKERLDHLMALVNPIQGGSSATVLKTVSGKKLDGIQYEHPLQSKIGKGSDRKIVMSDEFVTLEEGTGLVHTAPGHGPQDFIIGKRFGIEIFCPVNEQGKYTDAAGEYAGKPVREENKKIIEDLENAGALVEQGKITHRYPHCWRCKTPLIYISTLQWFIKISKTKERMLQQIETIKWQPDFAKTRFREFVSSAPDWCISRQRYWGIPLPIWECEDEKCGKYRVIGSAAELPKKVELHRPFVDDIQFDCECGKKMNRIKDVLDVWFDSGNAIWASLGEDEEYAPANFITEGKDQTRGWFYSLLGSGVVYNNEIPYKSLLMHGFFVDEKGEKMSKSVGNFVPLEEILDKYGADTFRMWSLSSTVWDDLKFNWDEIKEANRALSILSNLESFMQRFYVAPEKEEKEEKREAKHENEGSEAGAEKAAPSALRNETNYAIEDLWLLSRLNTLIEECTKHFDEYETHMVARKCRRFLVEDVSRFYLKIAKKRISAGENPETVSKVLFVVLFDALRLMSPITPFIAESFYQEFYAKYKEKESISLFSWPRFEPKFVDPLLENQMESVNQMVTALSNARQDAKIKLRWPVEEVIIVTKSTNAAEAAKRLEGTIKILANVKNVKVEEKIASKLTAKPVHSKLGPVFKKDAHAAAEAIEKADAEKLKEALTGEKKKAKLGEIEITPEMVQFDEITEGYAGAQFADGTAYVKTAINEALLSEAMAREVSRRIQMMRKEMKLVEKDLIEANVSCEKELVALIEKREGEIASEVKASKLKISEKPSEVKQAHEKEWEIEDYTVKISIKKA